MSGPMETGGGSDLRVESLTKRYGTIIAVDRVSFAAPHGELLAILGPSGSGKTTLLAMIGGQIQPDEGDILISGRSIVGLPPNKIDTATVFQEYALFPHLTVAENVGFGLKMRKWSRDRIRARVEEMLRLVGLVGLGDRHVHQLSGGERQRVATARALVVEPRVLLMDEPLGALDRKIRLHLQQELSDLLRKVNVTALLVTHDQQEAFSIADRVAVINAGALEQVDVPANLYRNPASRFVATFLGSGAMLDGRVLGREGDSLVVEAAGGRFRCRGSSSAGSEVAVLIRPEDICIAEVGRLEEPTWPEAAITRVVDGGETTKYTLVVGSGELSALELGLRRFQPGTRVSVRVNPGEPVIVPDPPAVAGA